MGYFKDAADVYEFIGRLLQELIDDPALGPRFHTSNTSVRYEMRDPEAQLTVDMRSDHPMRVDQGASDLDPEVVMTMAADTAHRFWLGKVNVTVALARGDIQAKGPVAKILRLVPLAKPAFPRYKQMLEDAGRRDLLEAS